MSRGRLGPGGVQGQRPCWGVQRGNASSAENKCHDFGDIWSTHPGMEIISLVIINISLSKYEYCEVLNRIWNELTLSIFFSATELFCFCLWKLIGLPLKFADPRRVLHPAAYSVFLKTQSKCQSIYAQISKLIWTQCTNVKHRFLTHEGQVVSAIIWQSWPMWYTAASIR